MKYAVLIPFSILASALAFGSDPTPPGEVCLNCHSDQVGRPHMHYPAVVRMCDTCHTATSAHLSGTNPPGSMTTDRTSNTCYGCHDRVDQDGKAHGALKLAEGCIACHDPHGSNKPRFIRKDADQVCTQCHTPVAKEAKSTHGIIKGDGCIICHEPHSSPNKSLLRVAPSQLCLTCHDQDIQVPDAADPKLRVVHNIKALVTQMPFTHSPATEPEGCVTCHEAHSSKFDRLLKDEFPVTKDYNTYNDGSGKLPNTFALCFQCHDKDMLKKDITADNTKFRSDTVDSKGRITRQNLHWFHVVDATGHPDKARGRSCRICHDAHGAAQAHNVKNRWNMGATFNVKIEFKPELKGGSCARSCHDLKTYNRVD